MGIFKKSDFSVETSNGVSTISYKDADAYKNGTQIPFKTLKEVDDYREQYVKEATEVAAEVAKDHMAKHKNVNKAIVDFGFGVSKRGKIFVGVDREKEVKIPKTGETKKSSRIRVIVKDPKASFSKSRLRELSGELTKALI